MKWMMRSTRVTPTDPCLAPVIGAVAGTGILKPLAIAEGFGKLRARGREKSKEHGYCECTERHDAWRGRGGR
jgi:hypothetical protein